MKVAFLLLILVALMSLAGCASAPTSTFGGPPAMAGSDSNSSDNRY